MRFALVIAVTVAALVAAAAQVVVERHRAVALGAEIARATAEQRRLEEQRRRLRIDRAALLDPARLGPLARRRGYRVPTPDEVVAVPRPAPEPAPVLAEGR